MNPERNEIYELIARSLTGEVTDAELKLLENWKSASENNLQEYNEIVFIWLKTGSLKLPERIDFQKSQHILYQRTGISSGRKRWISLAVQAAAVLLLSLIFSGVYSYFIRTNNAGNSPLEATVYQEIKAAYGTQSKVVLADGSSVYLNSGSKLTFPQTFSNQAERRVTLDGEGYFEVAKNKEQPFVVQANRLKIKVLGTKFNVDAYNDNTSVSVALVEGSVELQDNSGTQDNTPMSLAPNQIATLEMASQTLTKTDVDDLNKYTAWINGRIVFFGDPIQTVVKKLSKWYNVDIVISDKKLENYRFTGTFINEPLEQVLNVLSMTSQMTFIAEPAVKQSDNTVTKRKVILKSKI